MIQVYFHQCRVRLDEALCQFVERVMVLLREIDSEMENIRHSRFLAKRLQSAMHHVQNILIHLQRSGTHSAQQIRKLEQLRDNLRAI